MFYRSLLILFLLSSIKSMAQCHYCTSLEEALKAPEEVTHLNLSAEGLVQLPEGLNQFTNLLHLDLSSNLIDHIDFTELRLPFLEELNLSNNGGFNTMDVEGIHRALPELKNLNLSGNSIMYLSAEFGAIKHLETLNLSDNVLQFLPEEMSELKALKSLDLSGNMLNEAYWLKEMWTLEELDVSDNDDLSIEEVGVALLMKQRLKRIVLTPDVRLKSVPSVFANIPVEELELKGGEIFKLNTRICSNPAIKRVILNDLTLDNVDRMIFWANRFKSLEKLELHHMDVSGNLSEIYVPKLHFNDCKLDQVASLRKVKSYVSITAVDTDISSPGYIGNAMISTYSPAEISMLEGANMSEDMVSNTLSAIVRSEADIIMVSGTEARTVRLDIGEYNIPDRAFLTQSGEVYKGQVKLAIVEYKDPIQNALSGAPMTYSMDGVNEVFASSGMIDFRAYDEEGNALQPNPENTIKVKLKDLQPAEDSRLYVLNDTTRTWTDIGVAQATDYDKRKQAFLDSLNKLPDNLFYTPKVRPLHVTLSYVKSSRDPYLLKFNVDGTRRSLKKMPRKDYRIQTANMDQRVIAKSDWKVDTVMTDQIKDLLKSIRLAQRNATRFYRKLGIKFPMYMPDPIQDLALTPNVDHDNYRLSFTFMDSSYSLPVYNARGGSIRSIQKKEKQNWKKYKSALKIAERERKILDKHIEEQTKSQAQFVREQRAEFLANNVEREQEAQEYLSFGLTQFGMVNCDYFSRAVPDEYLAFTKTAIDQNGVEVQVPHEVRNIMLRTNSFVSTTSNRVPVYKNRKSIILFKVGDSDVAVINRFKEMRDGYTRPIVKRFSIEGMSADQVRDKILALGKVD